LYTTLSPKWGGGFYWNIQKYIPPQTHEQGEFEKIRVDFAIAI